MDELGFNKIAAAVLATALGFMFIKEISHSALHVSVPDEPAYRVGPVETAATEVDVDLPFPQPVWVDAMDATKGAKVFKKCTSCHNAEQGGANGTGPNLWNVVGSPAGTHAGFGYSGAMSNSGLTWDYETLDAYLTKPTRYLSGTAMNFIGLKKETDRAAVIEYLRQQADSPLPQPVAAVTEAPVEEVSEDASLMDAAEDVIEDGADAAGDIVEGAGDVAEDAVEAVEDAAKTVVDTVKDIADDVKEQVESDDQD